MILVNTTFAVEESLVADFLKYIRQEYIPKSLDGGGLRQPLLTQMRNPMSDDEGPAVVNFALQFRAESCNSLLTYQDTTMPRLLGDIFRRWGYGVAQFTSVLDVVYDPNVCN